MQYNDEETQEMEATFALEVAEFFNKPPPIARVIRCFTTVIGHRLNDRWYCRSLKIVEAPLIARTICISKTAVVVRPSKGIMLFNRHVVDKMAKRMIVEAHLAQSIAATATSNAAKEKTKD